MHTSTTKNNHALKPQSKPSSVLHSLCPRPHHNTSQESGLLFTHCGCPCRFSLMSAVVMIKWKHPTPFKRLPFPADPHCERKCSVPASVFSQSFSQSASEVNPEKIRPSDSNHATTFSALLMSASAPPGSGPASEEPRTDIPLPRTTNAEVYALTKVHQDVHFWYVLFTARQLSRSRKLSDKAEF